MAALAGQGQRTSRHCTGRTVRDKQTKQGWVGGTTHERRRQPPQVAHDARPCRRRLQTSIPYLYSLVASSHSLSMTPHVRTPPPPGLCARDQPLSRLRVALSPRVWTGAPMYGNEPSHAGWTDAAGTRWHGCTRRPGPQRRQTPELARHLANASCVASNQRSRLYSRLGRVLLVILVRVDHVPEQVGLELQALPLRR